MCWASQLADDEVLLQELTCSQRIILLISGHLFSYKVSSLNVNSAGKEGIT